VLNADAAPHVERRVSVVVLTHQRIDELKRCLAQLSRLPERPALIVVDNASSDGSAAFVARCHPDAELVRCTRNLGAAGRNAGVARVCTPYVAFCDDDTWWAAGALTRAADLLDRHAGVAAIAAHVLVGAEERDDPTCVAMAASPLAAEGLPGPALVSFMAGAVVMRTVAFREAGGYEPRLFLGAEEALLGMDLLAAGWHIVYARDVVTHHHPSLVRDGEGRRVMLARNRLWLAGLRLPWRLAWRESRVVAREAAAAGVLRPALFQALAGLPWVLSHRRVLPEAVIAMRERVYAPSGGCPAAPLPAAAPIRRQ
jgi:GT2 family glycosyltransferase